MSDLERVRELCDLLVEQETALQFAKEQFEQARDRFNRTRMEDLPNLMAEVGLSEVALRDGTRVRIREEVDARITDTNREAALAWLTGHGFSGLIKSQVILRTPHEEISALVDTVRQYADDLDVKEVVHPQTLKAFVREQLAAGASVPMDLFSVHPYSVAKIERRT